MANSNAGAGSGEQLVLAGFRVSSHRCDFLVQLANGRPAFLVQDPSPASSKRFQLRHISIDSGWRCRVSADGEVFESVFAVIECTSDEHELQALFTACVPPVLNKLPTDPTGVEVDEAIGSLVELFRSLSLPARKTVAGVWAELLLIAESPNFEAAFRAWHGQWTAPHDFVLPTRVFEVKATTLSGRIHHFSLDQLVSADKQVVIASLPLLRSSSGSTLADLKARICMRSQHEPSVETRLNQMLAVVLGRDYAYSDDRYDVGYTVANARFYDASDVPQVPKPKDQRVTAVRFTSDLSDCSPMLGAPLAGALLTLFAG